MPRFLPLLLASALLTSLHAQDSSSAPPAEPPPPVATEPIQPTPAEATPPANPAPLDPGQSEAASDEFSQQSLPPPPPPRQPRVIPTHHGDTTGEVWIGHRAVIDRYSGWGWIKREREPWSRARWVMLEEEPGLRMAPGRFHPRPIMDDNIQYRLYGTFAEYRGYEPNFDVFVDVFRIQGWETIGPAERPRLTPPRSAAASSQGRWSERGANLRR